MLFSRAGDYRPKQPLLHAECFSPNSAEGACPACHGLGRIYEVTEASMVPDDSLSIRERAIAAWPTAWQGQNLRDILTTLGYDVDRPWRELPQKARDWILFTEDQPTVPVYAGYDLAQTQRALKRKEEPSYQGTFTSARRYVMQTFSGSQSAMMKRRVARYMLSRDCPECNGKRLRREALSVRFAGLDIADVSALPLATLASTLEPYARGTAPALERLSATHPEKALVAQRITRDMLARLEVLLDLGLGYLALERSTPTLSPGELQRLRLATQVHSNLFGVVYVLDEPSAGLHPADTEALMRALERLKSAGNSLFVVEHELEVIRRADWVVDIGPGAGAHGGQVLFSGPLAGLATVADSLTGKHLFADAPSSPHAPRAPRGWLRLQGVTRNNLKQLDAAFPLGLLTSVTGVSGSGKSTLVSHALVSLVAEHVGAQLETDEADADELEAAPPGQTQGRIESGLQDIARLVVVDQRPIGRTPRSNLATYTGLFDHVRKLFAATPAARAKKYDAGRFSFNLPKGRCDNCEGEGWVMVELLFLPSVYTPCPACHGTRYNDKTLSIQYRGKNIAEVLAMTVDSAWEFFGDEAPCQRALGALREVGMGYARLGQPATELSGGEAQRIKLATELQRAQRAGTLYVLDEPTTGLHPADVERLMTQLHGLVASGATVVVVEHDLHVIAGSDWVIDMGPGAGDAGGRIVAVATPAELARAPQSRTGTYLARHLGVN
jgi:excinuclease ABC subunit A